MGNVLKALILCFREKPPDVRIDHNIKVEKCSSTCCQIAKINQIQTHHHRKQPIGAEIYDK